MARHRASFFDIVDRAGRRELATAPPDRARLRDLTIATLQPVDDAGRAHKRVSGRGDVALSVLLLLGIGAIWTIFSC